MHPQTLRGYDKLGLVAAPRRASGRGRRYSMRDVERLRLVQRLSQNEGINLEGIRHILRLQAEVEERRRRSSTSPPSLREARSTSPASSRMFTADTGGQVRLGSVPGQAVLQLTR